MRGTICVIRPPVFVRVPTQDAWGLGYVLWGMLSPDPAAAPYDGSRGAYVEPRGTVAGRRVDGAAAARIVRGLLRAASAERWSLDDAVAGLEAMLFMLPALESPRAGADAVSRRCVHACAGDRASVRTAVVRRLAALVAAAGSLPREGGRWRARDLLLLDFVTGPRGAPGALSATLARLA